MRELRRVQLRNFFEACEQELVRCKRDYTIDLENDDLMFEQEFEGLQDRINNIQYEIQKVDPDRDIGSLENEYHQYEVFFQIRKGLKDIINYVHTVIEESEGYEMGDYLISFNREDLRDRIDALCNVSLRQKCNTSLFDFNFENNRIIKTEILGKSTLKQFLNDEGDEFQVSGCRNVKTFINGPDVSKSLLDISGVFGPDKAGVKPKGHRRNTSSISSSFADKSLLGIGSKNQVSRIESNQGQLIQQQMKANARFKDVEAVRRDIRVASYVPIPKKCSTLILKEGRIFFSGGNLNDHTCNMLLEFIEEANTLFPHTKMIFDRQNHGVCFTNQKIYAIGGYNFSDHKWLDSIESLELPERPKIEYQNNYDILSLYEPIQSNQDTSPRSAWTLQKSSLKFGRSHISCTAQMERFIYIFCGKYGEPDSLQPTITNVKSTHVIERYDTIEDSIEEYVIKSCHKIGQCYSPASVPAFSSRRKNPGILFFGGKVDFEQKNLVKVVNKTFLMFPQDRSKAKQLSSKYAVKGGSFHLSIDSPEILQKKKKSKKDMKPIEVELFNGDIECLRKLDMFTEDLNYYYFLGCRDNCRKLELEDPHVQEHNHLVDKLFGKNPDPGFKSNVRKEDNVHRVQDELFGIEGLKGSNFEHPRHAHSIFMLDKSNLKWTSMPVVKYIPNKKFWGQT